MPREAKRRFVSLRVNEVSLVDSPANEQEFIVIKSLDQEEPMAGTDQQVANTETSAPANAESNGTQQASTEPVEKMTVHVEKAGNDSMAEALKQVTELVKSVASVAVKASETQPAADVKKDANQQTSDQPTDTETEKAKAFTPKRLEQVKNAMSVLEGLVKEVSGGKSETTTKVAEPEVPTVDTAKAAEQNNILSQQLIDLTKKLGELGEAVKNGLGGVSEITKSIESRVEAIEKTREPSKSIAGEGGTESTQTQKSFWSGVL